MGVVGEDDLDLADSAGDDALAHEDAVAGEDLGLRAVEFAIGVLDYGDSITGWLARGGRQM